jgi:DNA-binding HxlR family transcriptional regulator
MLRTDLSNWSLGAGPLRCSSSSQPAVIGYHDLLDAVEGISPKVLTDTLRRAERDGGLLTRHLDDGRVETATLYELTDLGRSLDMPLAALGRWVGANWQRVEAAEQHWDQRAGHN